MADIALKKGKDGSLDLDFEFNDLKLCDGLENATAISLGCFARERNLITDKANLNPVIGGWWADAISEDGVLGGYLHEVWPGKLNAQTLKKAKTIAQDSLSWMKKDGVASKVEVTATDGGGFLDLAVSVFKPNGSEETFEFELNWNSTNGI